MEYRRFGDKIVARLDRGEEVCEKLLELAAAEDIALAALSGIGAASEVTLGVFDTETKKYTSVDYAGQYEIASLTGNLSRKDGAPYLHLHAVIATPPEGKCHGGHLNKARISATGEIMIDLLNGAAERELSEEIGLNLYKF